MFRISLRVSVFVKELFMEPIVGSDSVSMAALVEAIAPKGYVPVKLIISVLIAPSLSLQPGLALFLLEYLVS